MAQKFTERQFTALPGGEVTDHSTLRMGRITTNQSIPNSTITVVVFNTTIFEVDDTGRITPNTGTGVVTVNEAGIYRITAGVDIAANVTGGRNFAIRVNGGSVAVHQDDPSVSNWVTVISTLVNLAATNTIDATVFQDSGGALNVNANTATHMTVEWAGPAT